MKDGRNIIIAALLVAVLVMSVGYSAFATQLEINGNATISGEWLIEITNISAVTTGLADAGDYSHTQTTATFDADLKQPGDQVVYTITVKNSGNIDAELDQMIMTPDSNPSPAISYTYTQPGRTLAAGRTTTFTVTVKYDEGIEEVPDNTSEKITGSVNYVQASA